MNAKFVMYALFMSKPRLLLIGLSILLVGCATTTGRLIKQGAELEAQGLYEEAASRYYDALKADPISVEAHTGLQRTGQLVLQAKLKKAEGLHQQEKYEDAYKKFVEAYGYRDKIKAVNISLKIPAEFDEMFSKTKNLAAQSAYQAGKIAFDNSNYRQAYRKFQEALMYVPDYEDASALSEEAMQKGKVRIAIFPFRNATRQHGVEEAVYTHVVSNAISHPSPFVEVMDRAHLQTILNEQDLSLSGVADANTAAKAGKVTGLQAVVFGTVVEAVEKRREPIPQAKTAYIWYERKVGEETYYRSEQTTYKVYEGNLTLTYKVNYQILDTETAKILKSDTVFETATDEIKYADYDGAPATLHKNKAPAKKAKGLGGIFASSLTGTTASVEQEQFRARRNFKTISELSSPLLESIGKQIAFQICQYFDEEVE